MQVFFTCINIHVFETRKVWKCNGRFWRRIKWFYKGKKWERSRILGFFAASTKNLQSIFSMEIVGMNSSYNELSLKTRFQSVPIAALCLYNIQRESLVFKYSVCTCQMIRKTQWQFLSADQRDFVTNDNLNKISLVCKQEFSLHFTNLAKKKCLFICGSSIKEAAKKKF